MGRVRVSTAVLSVIVLAGIVVAVLLFTTDSGGGKGFGTFEGEIRAEGELDRYDVTVPADSILFVKVRGLPLDTSFAVVASRSAAERYADFFSEFDTGGRLDELFTDGPIDDNVDDLVDDIVLGDIDHGSSEPDERTVVPAPFKVDLTIVVGTSHLHPDVVEHPTGRYEIELRRVRFDGPDDGASYAEAFARQDDVVEFLSDERYEGDLDDLTRFEFT